MAYLSFEDFAASLPDPMAPAGRTHSAPASFSPLEWSVIALAKNDSLNSLHVPGRVSQAMATVFGVKRSNRLADERLEALRRAAVLVWHSSRLLPQEEMAAFLAADFTAEQLDLLQGSVEKGRRIH